MKNKNSVTYALTIIAAMVCTLTTLAQTQQATPLPPDSTLYRMAANMLMVGFRGDSVTETSDAARYVRDLHIGALVLFDVDLTGEATIGSRNITSKDRLKAMTSQLQQWSDQPLIIALDQEGGRVARLKSQYGFSPTVQSEYLGATNCEDTTRYYGARIAREMNECGITLNLAPVVDLLYSDCPVIAGLHRAFSSDADITGANAGWIVDEHHKAGVGCTLKHFPGHGSSTGDTHYGLVDVTETWQERELEPFLSLISTDNADAIMTAHIYNRRLDSEYPATLSHAILTDLLRGNMGYEGVIITDDLYMKGIIDEFGIDEALILAINAGADLVCAGNNAGGEFEAERPFILTEIIVNAIKNGRIPIERIRQANMRTDKLRYRYAAHSNY